MVVLCSSEQMPDRKTGGHPRPNVPTTPQIPNLLPSTPNLPVSKVDVHNHCKAKMNHSPSIRLRSCESQNGNTAKSIYKSRTIRYLKCQ